MEFFETSLVGAILGLVIGLALLIFGAERFTHQAEKIGHTLGLPEFVIGVVIVSLGTSLPELVASIFAVLKDAPTIVAGSVVGSNITNTFFILGISFLFLKKSELKVDLIDIDLPFLLAATLLFVFMCIDTDYNYIDGALSVSAAILYFVTLIMRNEELMENESDEPEMENNVKHGIGPLTYVVIPVACVMIFFGGEWTVDAINNLSRILKLDQSAIAGTAIAFAGSLPELFICARFAAQGKIEIALGNVVGASIINALFVMGVCSFLGPSGHLQVSAETIKHGVPMMIAAVAIFIFVTIDRKVSKTEGGIFLIFYVFYLGRVLGVM